MTKKSKITAFLLTCILCFSVFSITVFADETVPYEDPNAGVSSDVVPEETLAPEPVPEVTQAPAYDDGSNDYNYDDNSDYNTNDYSDQSNDYYSNDSNNNYNFDSGEDTDNYSDDSYDYNSDANAYAEPETQATKEPDYYESDGKVDESELSDSDWEAIAQSLSNDNNSSGGDDFNFIKNNTSSGDNGLWMLILGAILVILAILGITYVIISSLNKKNKYAYAGAPNQRTTSANAKPRPRNDYGDGYTKSKKQPKLISKRRIEDTADIKLPRNSGGNRYKK